MVVIVMVMAVVVTMVMVVVVIVVMVMVMVVQALPRARAARVLVEYQRLDGDRHGVGRHANTAEVDVVEIPQHHAIDHQHVAFDVKLLAQDMAERLRHVAVEHDVKRALLGDAVGKPALDTFGKGSETLVRRQSGPAQRQRNVLLAVGEIERCYVAADGDCKLFRIDCFFAGKGGSRTCRLRRGSSAPGAEM